METNHRSTLVHQRLHTAMDLNAFNHLAQRILGEECAKQIRFALIRPPHKEAAFAVYAEKKHLVIEATDGPALGVAFNRYLNEVAGIHVSLHGSRMHRPDRLALPDKPITGTSWAEHRYFLNYCAFSYSMPFWGWEAWEKLVDWMVLRGVNRPLAITGQEAVWLRVGERLGLTREEMKAFLSGPAYLPFNWMGCLDGWAGPLSDAWCTSHEELGQKIIARERAFGMTPVLQGFTGHVPAALDRLLPASAFKEIQWHEWSTRVLDPLDKAFESIAEIYLQEQQNSFGTDHIYAADTFIEMRPPSGESEYLRALGIAIYEGMRKSDSRACWILQGWVFSNDQSFWTLDRIHALLSGVPADRILILDLFCESQPMWRTTKAFQGRPWLWCNVQSFGANTLLHGSFAANRDGLRIARHAPEAASLKGIGMVNEGLCPNPVAYDFFFDQAWSSSAVDTTEWLKRYVRSRYGASIAPAMQAWALLYEHIYAHGQQPDQIYMLEHLRRPHWEIRGRLKPEVAVLHAAWALLLNAEDTLKDVDTYRFDLVNLGRQVLSNHACWLKSKLQDAFDHRDSTRFHSLAGELKNLLHDMEDLLQTRSEFLLGSWIADAVAWGKSPAEMKMLEMNARRIITLWGASSKLVDYARKEWAGLLSGYYLPRWLIYLQYAEECLDRGDALDVAWLDQAMLEHESAWVQGSDAYATTPSGDALAISTRLMDHYASQAIAGRLTAPEGRS